MMYIVFIECDHWPLTIDQWQLYYQDARCMMAKDCVTVIYIYVSLKVQIKIKLIIYLKTE